MNLSLGQQIIAATVATGAAIGIIYSGAAWAYPFFETKPPFAAKLTLVQLEQKTFDAVQSLRTEALSNAQSWCEIYMRREADDRAAIGRNPSNAEAQKDVIFAASQRKLWCGEVTRQ